MVREIDRIRRRQKRNSGVAALVGKGLRPIETYTGFLIHLVNRLLPSRLVRLLASQRLEAWITDNRARREMLKLGGLGPGVSRQVDQSPGTIEVTVVVGRDVGDEVDGPALANFIVPDTKGSRWGVHQRRALPVGTTERYDLICQRRHLPAERRLDGLDIHAHVFGPSRAISSHGIAARRHEKILGQRHRFGKCEREFCLTESIAAADVEYAFWWMRQQIHDYL